MTRRLPRTILMTTDAVGGVWTYSTDLASALAERGHDVHLVTMGPAPSASQRDMVRGDRVHLHETKLMLEWQDPAGQDMPRARQILRQLETRIAPDIVHLNSYREAAFGWRAPVVVVAHSCVQSWSLACGDHGWSSDARWRHYAAMVATGLGAAQAWVSPSHSFRDVVCKLHRPASPGRVIWNGVTRISGKAVSNGKTIIAAGRLWDKAKNISALARAAQGLDRPVKIAGSLAQDDLPSTANVTMLGDVPRPLLREQMHSCEIFVSPAFYEPFGLSVLEAAAAGCALVLSDIPTFRELWSDAAAFVDADDVASLHGALSDLCFDDARRKRLQRAAFERSRLYTLARTADAYQELYRTLVEPAQRGAADVQIRISA